MEMDFTRKPNVIRVKRITAACLVIVTWICVWSVNHSRADFNQASGQYVQLTTDLPLDEARSLVVSSDQAIRKIASRWQISLDKHADLQVQAFVMSSRPPFAAAGLIGDHIPDFASGYAVPGKVFIYAQQSAYYTRHLLIHELVHACGFKFLSGLGPTWFMEGTAEWLATHSGQGATLKLAHFPESKTQVPYWGRITAVRNLYEKDQCPSLASVMRTAPTFVGNIDTYATSWAAVSMMASYPEYKKILMTANQWPDVSTTVFNRRIATAIRPNWPIVAARWRLWVDSVGYGMDPSRHLVELSINDKVFGGNRSFLVRADQGWQSTGVRFNAGMRIRLSVSGRVVIDQEKGWESEPQGVSLKYINDRPWGQLIVAIVPCQVPKTKRISKLQILSVDSRQTITFDEPSWLVAKVNEHAGGYADNSGSYRVQILGN